MSKHGTMFVAVYYTNSDIRIREAAKPTIGSHEILVKVMASGICGSDVMEWYRAPTAPRILGHEATGVIEKVGEKVANHRIGERVFVSHHVPCNACRYCRRGHHTACETLHKTNYDPGGFSQYIRVPQLNVQYGVYPLPPDISYEEGTFIEPLGCVVRSQRLASVREEDVLLVIGSGISGILHVQLARLKGISKIVAADINPYRLKLAKRFGASDTIDARHPLAPQLQEATGGTLASQVILCTGATPALREALNCVDRGGTILFFAVPPPQVKLPVPITQFWRNEITIKTSYGAAPRDLQESLALLTRKGINVGDLVTHKLPLTKIAKGFELVAKAGKSLKVIITPNT